MLAKLALRWHVGGVRVLHTRSSFQRLSLGCAYLPSAAPRGKSKDTSDGGHRWHGVRMGRKGATVPTRVSRQNTETALRCCMEHGMKWFNLKNCMKSSNAQIRLSSECQRFWTTKCLETGRKRSRKSKHGHWRLWDIFLKRNLTSSEWPANTWNWPDTKEPNNRLQGHPGQKYDKCPRLSRCTCWHGPCEHAAQDTN